MGDDFVIIFRLLSTVIGRSINQVRFFSILAMLFFGLSIFGGGLSAPTDDVFYSFCVGQAVFLIARLLVFVPLSFFASGALAITGRDFSPPSWDVYFEKLILAFDIGIIIFLTLRNPVGSWLGGIVSWALTLNYLGNVLLRIVSRMSPDVAKDAFAYDIVSIVSLPLAMFFGLLFQFFLLFGYVLGIGYAWHLAEHSREANFDFPVVFASAGFYYLMQITSRSWIDSIRRWRTSVEKKL